MTPQKDPAAVCMRGFHFHKVMWKNAQPALDGHREDVKEPVYSPRPFHKGIVQENVYKNYSYLEGVKTVFTMIRKLNPNDYPVISWILAATVDTIMVLMLWEHFVQ